jgi:uncharacterized protein (DUF302 family)
MNTPLGLNITLKTDYTTALTRVTDALKAEGFGVLTEIDVKETMKRKLGVEYSPYKILGACNPSLAHRALTIAPEVGLLLPCNVVVRQIEDGTTEVSLVDPLGMMAVVGNPELQAVAQEARTKLERVASSLKV